MFSTKRFARLILAVFVVSVINMSMQMPVHAAMQMNNLKISAAMSHEMSMDVPESSMHGSMNNHMDDTMSDSMADSMDDSMGNCHCPPALCESVLAVDNQSTDGMLVTDASTERVLVSIIEILDQNHGQFNQYLRFTRNQLSAEQSSLPPLLRKTLLLI